MPQVHRVLALRFVPGQPLEVARVDVVTSDALVGASLLEGDRVSIAGRESGPAFTDGLLPDDFRVSQGIVGKMALVARIAVSVFAQELREVLRCFRFQIDGERSFLDVGSQLASDFQIGSSLLMPTSPSLTGAIF